MAKPLRTPVSTRSSSRSPTPPPSMEAVEISSWCLVLQKLKGQAEADHTDPKVLHLRLGHDAYLQPPMRQTGAIIRVRVSCDEREKEFLAQTAETERGVLSLVLTPSKDDRAFFFMAYGAQLRLSLRPECLSPATAPVEATVTLTRLQGVTNPYPAAPVQISS